MRLFFTMAKVYFICIFLLSGFSDSCKSTSATLADNPKAEVKLSNKQLALINSLNRQAQITTSYNPAYVAIPFPNGDVDSTTGVCADVIVRALRAVDIDLQKEIHADISKHFNSYPNIWHSAKPDKNIDHRRVPNIMCYLQLKGKAVVLSTVNEDYKAGDIVAWKLENGLYHIGMVSNSSSDENTPLIFHNIGSGTKEADVLFRWKIIGHYRI